VAEQNRKLYRLQELFARLTRLAMLAASIVSAASLVVPLFAIATGAYPSLPISIGAVSQLVAFFLPQALLAGLQIGVPMAIFLGCRRARVSREALATVGAFTIAAGLVTAALSVWIVPVTSASYRTLAFGDPAGRMVDGRRLNEPGGPGDRSQARQRWGVPASVLVFAAFATVAASVPPHRPCELT